MKQINLRDFLDFTYISNMKASPDHHLLAYVRSVSDETSNTYKSYLHIINQQQDMQVTSGGKEQLYVWEDEHTLLFSSVREEADVQAIQQGEERTVFYRIDTQGGEARKAFQIPLLVNDIQVLHEHTYLLSVDYDLRFSHAYMESAETRAEILKAKKDEQDYEVLDELPFYANGAGYTNKKRTALFLYDAISEELTRISDELFQVNLYTLNDTHTALYYTGQIYTRSLGLQDGLYVYEFATATQRKLIQEETYDISLLAYWQDTLLLAMSDQQAYGLNQNPKFYTLDTNGTLDILLDFDQALGNSVGSDARYGKHLTHMVYQNHFYFIATIGFSSVLYELDADGKLHMVYEDRGSIDGFTFLEDGLYVYAMRDMKPQEIYHVHEQIQQITKYHTSFYETKDIRKPIHTTIKRDDNMLDGWVLLPRDFQSDKQYPAILDIHGGPKTVYGEVYYHEMQVWANLGYVVFFMNPRGSDGLGNAFADIRGAYGTFDYEDLMCFTDHVLATYPQIDVQRLGVTGGSYGGFMTNWIITHTQRFAAAASQRSISNWLSFAATSDIGAYFASDQQQGDLWKNPEKLWQHSPLNYADKCTTPTLFIHSNEDYRCPYSEGLQMYSALCMQGIETRLCMFKGENHELSRSGKPKHRIRRLEEITRWMNGHLC